MVDQEIDYIHNCDDGPRDGSRGTRRRGLRCTTTFDQELRDATA